MEPTGRRRNPVLLALALTGAVAIVGGLALGFLGVGAQLAQRRTVVLRVRTVPLEKAIADQIRVGDTLYTDTAGVPVGRIVSLVETRVPVVVSDARGGLHLDADPIDWQVEADIEGAGREGNGLVALDTQVVQAGESFNIISKSYYIGSQVVNVDVR